MKNAVSFFFQHLFWDIDKNKLDFEKNQKIMITNPQRWTNNKLLWTKELVLQNTKNIVKKLFFVKKYK